MNIKRKLIILITTAALSACAAQREKPSVGEIKRPAAAPAATSVEPTAAKTPSEAGDGVVVLPLDQTVTPSTESPPVSEAPASPEMKMTEEAPTPGVASPAPAGEAASAPQTQSMPATAPTMNPARMTPPKAMTVVADRVPREYTITVAMKNPSDPFYGRGSDMAFVVDGTQGKEIVLTRGVTYIFHVRTNVQHDFYFTTSPMGRGAGTVTDGIKGQFTYIGDVTFTPTAATPDVMYYACRNHAFMGGKIHIANPGDKITVGGEIPAAPEISAENLTVSAAQVKQKLSFAEMMMGDSSPPAKRVAASANIEAKNLFAQAKQRLDGARAALNAGNNAGAMQAANESLQLISEAGSLVAVEPTEGSKTRYEKLVDQLQGFEKSYQKNLERGLKPKSGKELDKSTFDRLVKEAEGFAAKEQYQDGVKRLEAANDMLTKALSSLLEAQPVVYDKNFATPKEEYEYESSRYDSYEELIPLAIEQRRPSQQTVVMMHELEARAKEIRGEGKTLAAKGDHKQAIMALQAATERLQRALRLAGVE
jgi:hypothetical protein